MPAPITTPPKAGCHLPSPCAAIKNPVAVTPMAMAQMPAPVAMPVRKIQPSRFDPWLCLTLA
jgi:hypothetical protein